MPYLPPDCHHQTIHFAPFDRGAGDKKQVLSASLLRRSSTIDCQRTGLLSSPGAARLALSWPPPRLLLAPAPVPCVSRREGTWEERARCLLGPRAAHLACSSPALGTVPSRGGGSLERRRPANPLIAGTTAFRDGVCLPSKVGTVSPRGF